MKTIGNVLWLVLGGFWMGIGWWLAGLVMAISIIGLPWARSCFVIGSLCFSPFGREAIDRKQLTGRGDLGTGPLGLVGNLLWFVFAGLWLAIGHLAAAIACGSRTRAGRQDRGHCRHGTTLIASCVGVNRPT